MPAELARLKVSLICTILICELQEDLKEKTKNLQSMKAELDMRHAQVDDYKFNIKQMHVCASETAP